MSRGGKMKQFLLGTIIGLLLFPVICDLIWIVHHYNESALVEKAWEYTLNPTYNLADLFIKGCTKDVSQNGHGWVFVNREYYSCGKIEIWISDKIFGEYTHPINPELLKKLKHNYRM